MHSGIGVYFALATKPPHAAYMIEPTFNRTKMIATMGPASAKLDVLKEMIRSGVDVCRINASHGSHEDHQKTIDLIRSINRDEDVQIPILLDLQGPKIRIGKLPAPIPIHTGMKVIFDDSLPEAIPGDPRVPMQMETFSKDVKVGDIILVEDGKQMLRVLAVNSPQVELEVIGGTEIGSRKGVNLPFSNVSLPSLSDKDREDLMFGIKNQVEWVALSFVRRAEDITELRDILKQHGSSARIIAKIEKPEALTNIDAIIAASDGIMVARGDLGVEIPTEEVPFWQKRIVSKCNMAARPVIVATQMLESMIENMRPTRAEATDVANAVLDGADCVMVSGETSVGKYPIEVVKTMQKILAQAEKEDVVYRRQTRPERDSPTFLSDAICFSAVKMSNGVGAKGIVSMTRSGYTAYQLSRHRPRAPIFIFTDNRVLLNTLSLVWGVRTFYYDSFTGTNETIQDVTRILKGEGYVAEGDILVNTASMPLQEQGRTNMLKLTIVG